MRVYYCVFFLIVLVGNLPFLDSFYLKPSLLRIKSDLHVTTSDVDTENKSNLKVPAAAWRWPADWPYPPEFLAPVGNGNASTFTNELDDIVIGKFHDHVTRFCTVGDRILTIDQNRSSKKFSLFQSQNVATLDIQDLVTNNPRLPFDNDAFDKVVLLSGIESLSEPRDVFREIWRVMKPGAISFSCFSNKPVLLGTDYSPLSMWTTMNDEQKIWIAGSYFHYSAVGGWENIEGYDLLSSTSKTMVFEKSDQEESSSAYVVQASKIILDSMELSETNTTTIAKFIQGRMLALKNMGEDDRRYSSLRLATVFADDKSDNEKAALLACIPKLTEIYSVLKDIKEVVIPSPIKAMLAILLLEKWQTGSPELIRQLRMAVSLETPSADLWTPLGRSTNLLPPKEKIYFLADVLCAMCGTRGMPDDRLSMLPDLMQSIMSALKQRLPEADEARMQAFAVDIAISDHVNYDGALSPNETAGRVLRFVQTCQLDQLKSMV